MKVPTLHRQPIPTRRLQPVPISETVNKTLLPNQFGDVIQAGHGIFARLFSFLILKAKLTA
jgi:hypothetical protein